MDNQLPLLKGTISLREALRGDNDVVHALSLPEKRLLFYYNLCADLTPMTELVARHLNIAASYVSVNPELREWLAGSFNLSVPVTISRAGLPPKVWIRFVQPYKIGEEHHPGNVEEKTRCEAATYIWLNWNCPSIPIPRLLGFGLPGGLTFTAVEYGSFLDRLGWWWHRAIAWLCRGQRLPPYFTHTRDLHPEVGYLLLENAPGQQVYSSWAEHHTDPHRRANFYRDFSRVLLATAKCPLPRIGSWTIDNRGAISLTNRPMTDTLLESENRAIAPAIPRHMTYTSSESYYLDLLACLDANIRDQPNAVHNDEDGRSQMAYLTAMRAILYQYLDQERRQGPYALFLTDLHRSNVYVDDDWNITCIIDLEWACVRPVEMLAVPYWLSGHALDDLLPGTEALAEYSLRHQEFADSFEQQEKALYGSSDCTRLLTENWSSGRLWYHSILDRPSMLSVLFGKYIEPKYVGETERAETTEEQREMSLASYWIPGTSDFLARKARDQKAYTETLHEMFAAAESAPADGDVAAVDGPKGSAEDEVKPPSDPVTTETDALDSHIATAEDLGAAQQSTEKRAANRISTESDAPESDVDGVKALESNEVTAAPDCAPVEPDPRESHIDASQTG